MRKKIAAFPHILWIVLFVVAPMLLVIFFAVTDQDTNFTLKNLADVGEYSDVFLRSIFLGAVATLICLFIGYPFAYFMSLMKEKHQTICMALLMLPMWMNFLLRTYAWMTLLENNGLINKFLRIFGMGPLKMINTQGAVVLGMVYNFLPYMILPIYSVLLKMDSSIIEAAEDLGSNKITVFKKVILPLSLPGIISGVTMVFVPAVSTFIISKMLGGGSNILIGDLIEMKFLGSSYNPHLGSAISLVLMLLILICMGIMYVFDSEEEKGEMLM